MFSVPFVLYADFESFITPSGEHVPSGFCCLRTSKFPEHDHNIYTYSGTNVLDEFFAHIKREQNFINQIISTNVDMKPLSDEDRLAHDSATFCSTCEESFNIKNWKVYHHCHVTGNYIGPVCNNCDMQLKHRKFNNEYFIPLFMHNARSYDSHFIIKNFHNPDAKVDEHGQISRISY